MDSTETCNNMLILAARFRKNNGLGLLVTGNRTGVQKKSKTRCRFDFNTVAG